MQANGVELSYHIQGEGEPLLLHMGIGQQWVLWPPDLMNRLEAAGFQVIAYDYRDTGQSSVMDHLGPPKALSVLMGALMGRSIAAPYTLWDLADDAAGLLDGLGITSAHTMGISMGGMVAQCLTIRHPARVRSLCSIMSTTGSRRHAVGQPHALRTLLRPVPQEEEAAVEHVVRVYQVLGGSHYHQDMDWLRSRFRLSAQR